MGDSATARATAILHECAVIAAFTLLAVLGTYPLILDFTASVPAGGDSWMSYWNLFWVKRAVLDLHVNPFFAADLYYPYGASLYFHTLNFFQSALGLPVAVGWGLPVAYNVLVLLSFVFSGYATYRLGLYALKTEIGRSETESNDTSTNCAAFLAGVVFTYSSYRYVHVLGHLDLISTQWLPLFALFILKAAREPGWRNAVFAAVFLTAGALTTSYYLLFLLVFTGLVVVWTVIRRPDGWHASLARIAGALILAGLLLSPVLIPMAQHGGAAGRTPDPAYDIDRFSGDFASFVIPSARARWSQGWAAPARSAVERPGTSIEGTLYLGVLPVILAGLGLADRARRGFWLFVFIAFSILALGPALYFLGSKVQVVSWLMPYRLLLALPFGDVPRVPARFIVMAGIGLAMLASFGAWRVFRDRPRRTTMTLTAVFCAAIIAEQAAVPLPLSAAEAPAYYSQLAMSRNRGGLIEVPIPPDPSAFPERMLYQTVHGLPVYGGYLARGLPPLPFPAVPGFGQFASLSPNIDDVVPYPEASVDAISRSVLTAYNADHLVIDRHLLTPVEVEAARVLADRLFGTSARAYEDAHTLAYAIPKATAPGPAAVWLDTGWSYLERDAALASDGRTRRWRWMGERARFGVMSPLAQRIRLKISAQSFGRPRRLQLLVNGAQVGLLEIGINVADYETPSIPIGTGVSFIELVSLDGTDSPGADRRFLSVALYRAQPLTER